MIDVSMKIGKIDYDESFHELFPKLVENLNSVQNPRFSIRFLRKMGAEAPDAFFGVLERLSQKDKDEFLLFAVRCYRDEWIVRLKNFMSNHPYGKKLDFDDISLERDEGGHLSLRIQNLKVDYAGMMENEDVQEKAEDVMRGFVKKKLGSGTLGIWAEKHVSTAIHAAAYVPSFISEENLLLYLQKRRNRQKVTEVISNAINASGARVELLDAEFVKPDAAMEKQADTASVERAPDLPDSLAEALLDALSSYMRELRPGGADRKLP